MDRRSGPVNGVELYVVMLFMADSTAPQRVCRTGQGNGLLIHRETVNCWYLKEPPHGLPERYRKVDEYRLISNKYAIYIFGQDRFRLVAEWNKATSATV